MAPDAKPSAWERGTPARRDVNRDNKQRARELERTLGDYENRLRGKMFARETAERNGNQDRVRELKEEFDHLAAEERRFRDELTGLKKTGLRSSRRSTDQSTRADLQSKIGAREAVRNQHGVGGKTGTIFNPDEGFVDDVRTAMEDSTQGGQFQRDNMLNWLVNGGHNYDWTVDTRENKVQRARDAATGSIEHLRQVADDGVDSDVPMADEVRAFIQNSTDAEVMAKLEEAAQEYTSNFDPRIRVAAKPERVDDILRDPDRRIKSTHEAQSAMSLPMERRALEATWGYPLDAPPETRPVSGSLDHKEFRKLKEAHLRARIGEPGWTQFGEDVLNPEFLADDVGSISPSGRTTEVYGAIEFVLKPDRANDSGMVFGDSALQGSKRPTSITSNNAEDLLASILSPETGPGGRTLKQDNKANNRLHVQALLNGAITGDWNGVHDPEILARAARENISTAEAAASTTRYVETLTPGGFDFDEVEHVSVPISTLDSVIADTGRVTASGEAIRNKTRRPVRDMELAPGDIGRNHPDIQKAFAAHNLSEAELNEILSTSNLRGSATGTYIRYMQEYLAAKEKKRELKRMGLDAIFPNSEGIDHFNPRTWLSLPPAVWGGTTPSQDSNSYELLQHLIRVSIIKDSASMVRKLRQPVRIPEGSVV